jgi:NADH:ubiquinone oxidoreductase subunit 6 (subunit J)
MKILTSIGSGIQRSARLWKAILIIWIVYLIIVSLVAIPVRASLTAALGNSMITEKLRDGINTEIFADMGAALSSIKSYLTSGFMILFVVSLILNSFFTAGLFSSLSESGNYSSEGFFKASASRFWPFFQISVIINVAVFFMMLIVVGLPVSILTNASGISEGTIYLLGMLFISFFILILIIILIIADYARAWQAINNNSCFKALGYGLRQTFKTFSSSYLLMFIVIAAQLLFAWVVLQTIGRYKPVTSTGFILLFLLSQVLFIIRLFLKSCRYGSFTRMKEIS